MRRPIAPPRRRSRLPSAPAVAVLIGGLGFGLLWLLVEPPGASAPADTATAPAAPAAGGAQPLIGPGPPSAGDPSTLAATPASPARPDAQSARSIAGGEAILPAPEVSGPLVRAEAPQRPPPAEKPPAPLTLARVQVDVPGSLRADRQTIRLDGIRAPDLDRVCTDGDGRLWPCGVQARSALRAFIGARRVTCTPPVPVVKGRPDEATASCAVGSHDLAEWLVSQGWAEPGEDAPENFAALADEARDRRLGLWQPAPALHAPITPPRTMPETIGVPVPVGQAPAEPPAEAPAEGPPVNLITPAR